MVKRKLIFSSFILLVILNSSFGQRITKYFKDVKDMTAMGDYLFFVADDGIHGLELWKSDGSTEGTVLVKDIRPGDRASSPSSLFAHEETLYFAADDGINGVELWKSDGTENGTLLVKNIKTSSGFSHTSSTPSDFFVFNGELFFSAIDNHIISGRALWKTDGTLAGTKRSPELAQYAQRDVVAVNEHLYFLTNSGPQELWKYDGNTGERHQIEVDDFYIIDRLNSFNNELYFITSPNSGNDQIRLYKLSPTDDLLLMLAEFTKPRFGGLNIDNFIEIEGIVFFSLRTDYESQQETDELWKTDGTVDGTSSIKTFEWNRHLSQSFMQNFIEFKDQLYFRASSGESFNLWKSDGTEDGTVGVFQTAVIPETEPIVSNEQLFFSGQNYLYVSDGTTEGTKRFSEIRLLDYLNPTILEEADDRVFFKAERDDNLALWTTSLEPNLEVSKDASLLSLSQDENIEFTSKLDSCSTIKFVIKNTGNTDLALSGVTVSGIDFYLSGSIPKTLAVGSTSEFELSYFPAKSTPSKASLKIYTSDRVHNVFNLNLSGMIVDGVPETKPQPITLLKKLIPGDESDQILLSSNSIVENSSPDSEVGILSLASGESGTNFTLVSGAGDRDNELFSINDDKLLVNTSIDFENDNTLILRIKSTNNANESIEQVIVLNIININEDYTSNELSRKGRDLFYSLMDVKYLDEDIVFAIGQKGTILKSDDGGQAWTKVVSGTTEDLLQIQFTDSQTGYISGKNGFMLKTENSGQDWFPLIKPYSENSYSTDFQFVSNDIGFIFSGDDAPYKTVDGGRSWTEYSVGSSNIYGGYFINENKGFLLSSSKILYSTTDGGLTWEQLDLRSQLNGFRSGSIVFVNEDTGFIYSSSNKVLKTNDRGMTWTSVTSVPSEHINSIYFKDENIAYAVGDWHNQNLHKTEDGGITWVNQGLEFSEGSFQSIGFSPNGSKATIVGRTSSLGSSEGPGYSIQHWENNTWKTITSLPSVDFRSVTQTSALDVFIFGDQNLKSSDGGVMWEKMDLNVDSPVIESHFINETTGFALSSFPTTRVLKTIDKGNSWAQLTLEGTISLSYNKIYFYNENIGFIMGRGSAIHKTTDGGNTWIQIPMDIESYSSIESIHFFNEQQGLAVSGIVSKILQTNDGGLTWSTVEEFPSPTWIRHMTFVNNQIGIAVGQNGFMIRTEDGGNTWTEVKTGYSGNLLSLKFLSEQHGYAVGFERILETQDGGLTWSPILFFRDLHDLSESNGILYVVGTDGFVWTTGQEQELPSPSGYISGEMLVPVNTTIDYSVPTNPDFNYTWEVSGNNKLTYYNGNASIEWIELGTHTLSAIPNNSVGSGMPRTVDVTVVGLPTPSIEGPEEVFKEDTGISYETVLNSGHSYIWSVNGASSYTPNNNSLSVDWSNDDQGLISVIETNLASGGRQNTTLLVDLKDPDIITSIEDNSLLRKMSVFPNPSEKSINISIKGYQDTKLKVRIIDLSGTVYKSQDVSFTEQFKLDIDDLPSGLYILEINSKNDKAAWKVIKR